MTDMRPNDAVHAKAKAIANSKPRFFTQAEMQARAAAAARLAAAYAAMNIEEKKS